jgi:uncharacterized OB-fold protein
MSKAQKFIEITESYNDFTKSDDEIRYRVNHRYGTRCPNCGRLLAKIEKLPATRKCPSNDCARHYDITRSGQGLMFNRRA